MEAFEDRILRSLFRVTLKEDERQDIHGHKLIYLPGVRSELEDQGAEPRLSVSILDQALLEAASVAGQSRPLSYLLPCWKRVKRFQKSYRRGTGDDPKFNVILEARRLCISYSVFAITMPEMFGLATLYFRVTLEYCISKALLVLTYP